MINTFLFDLDGTLLPMKWEVFEREYFKCLTLKLSDYFEPSLLVKFIWQSTMNMIKNTGGIKTNKQVFFEDFIEATGGDINILNPIFDEFYLNEFNNLKQFVWRSEYIIKAVRHLKDCGYEMVVATNPVFPITAIKNRIRWAGLDEKYFKYITCYEYMHYCKPNIDFYREVLDKINKKPEECIMVGNDVVEDLVASKIGIKTFLIEDCVINKTGKEPEADFVGRYEDFYRFVRNMSNIKACSGL